MKDKRKSNLSGLHLPFRFGAFASPSKAKDLTREIKDFYQLGSDCLWITFADGHLWWTFAQPEVIWLGLDDDNHGARMRKTSNGWHKTDSNGEPLQIDRLNSRLTQVAAYRQTLCQVKAEDYLLRRINGDKEPLVAQAQAARSEMIKTASKMISDLHWADFETLVDIIFSRAGWQRRSALGGSLKDIDLALEHPTTNEKAFVQVKSRAGQAVLDDYIDRYQTNGSYDRLFFVCHSPAGKLAVPEHSNLHVWAGDHLADAAVKAGLFDWLIERSV